MLHSILIWFLIMWLIINSNLLNRFHKRSFQRKISSLFTILKFTLNLFRLFIHPSTSCSPFHTILMLFICLMYYFLWHKMPFCTKTKILSGILPFIYIYLFSYAKQKHFARVFVWIFMGFKHKCIKHQPNLFRMLVVFPINVYGEVYLLFVLF